MDNRNELILCTCGNPSVKYYGPHEAECPAQGVDHRVLRDDALASQIPREQRCLKCGGTGNQFMFMYQRCDDCLGRGFRQIPNMWTGLPQGKNE